MLVVTDSSKRDASLHAQPLQQRGIFNSALSAFFCSSSIVPQLPALPCLAITACTPLL
jgi:hypothetical protein